MPVDPRLTERIESTPEEIEAAYIGGRPPSAPVTIEEYDPAWPDLFAREAARIRSILGDTVRSIEHVGSTAVPGLAAKPIIDIDLVVPDSADEPAYVPAMEAAGYRLYIREPNWHEHRLFKGPDTNINLHVFSPGIPETTRHLVFRDWLRGNDDDRALYESAKRVAAAESADVYAYNGHKEPTIDAIYQRAFAAYDG